MRYIPFSNLGHLLSSGSPPDLEYLLRAASVDGASVDQTTSGDSPITHFPVVVRQINIKENPNVVCFQPRGQGHCVLFTLSHDSAPSPSRLFQAVKIGITSYYWMLWRPSLSGFGLLCSPVLFIGQSSHDDCLKLLPQLSLALFY